MGFRVLKATTNTYVNAVYGHTFPLLRKILTCGVSDMYFELEEVDENYFQKL